MKTPTVFLLLMLFATGGNAMALELSSPAFDHGGKIPAKFTCDGNDIPPALSWTGVPAKTQSLVLILDDPDAPVGTWNHWVLFNIPPTTTGLPEGGKPLPAGTLEGTNSWRRTGWGGPCPPDREHRYFFKLYALDAKLSLKTGATKKDIETAMKGHVLAQSEWMGRYERRK